MPVTGHLISGTIYDIFGIALAGSTVQITHSTITPVLSATTDSSGKYIINLAGLSSQWSSGNSISVKASKTAEGRKTITTTIQGQGGQTINITLDEDTDINYETHVQDRYVLNLVIPKHYDGLNITRLRPFPVQTEETLGKYYTSDQDVSGSIQYLGYTDRFGNWYIQKYDTSAGTYRYSKGSSDYPTNWTNRTTLNYDYFHNVF